MTLPIPARQGQEHLTTLLTALARVQLGESDQTMAEWLPRRIADLEWGATLIVVTPKLDEDELWMLHNAYRRGSNAIALVCAAQPNFAKIRAQGERLHVLVHRTIWEKDLHELAERVQT